MLESHLSSLHGNAINFLHDRGLYFVSSDRHDNFGNAALVLKLVFRLCGVQWISNLLVLKRSDTKALDFSVGFGLIQTNLQRFTRSVYFRICVSRRN